MIISFCGKNQITSAKLQKIQAKSKISCSYRPFNMGWIGHLKEGGPRTVTTLNEKRGSLPSFTTINSPLFCIASYSLLRNMLDALYGTTLIFCMHLIPSTKHPGFHLNRKMKR